MRRAIRSSSEVAGLNCDKTLKLNEGHAHGLLNDVDKQVVMADIQGWMNAHLCAA